MYTALVTPFQQDGSVNYTEFRKLIRFQIEAGVDGLVVLGTTGEAPTLTSSERKELISVAREETLGRCSLMVGTGSYSTAQTIENSLLAQQLGADSLLVITPYYNKPTPQGIYLHYKALTEAVGLPIIVYTHQGRTAQNIQPETLLRIAQLPGILGVKEAAAPIGQIIDIIEIFRQQRKDFTILSGDDGLTVPLMAAGGHGVISVASNLLPIQMKKLVQAMEQGFLVEAQNVFYELLPLLKAFNIETNPIPIKAAMELSGMKVGGCRLPLCPLLPENQAKLMARTEQDKDLIDLNYALYARHAELALTR